MPGAKNCEEIKVITLPNDSPMQNWGDGLESTATCVILRCVIPVVCRKTNGEVNISHENTTMVVWIYIYIHDTVIYIFIYI